GHRRRVAQVLDLQPLRLVHRPRHPPREPAPLRAPAGQAQPLLQGHHGHRIPLRVPGLGVGRARRHRQPHRLRPLDALQALRDGPELLQPGHQRALHPVRDRARRWPDPLLHGLPRRCLHRGRGAQRQGRRGQAHGAQARSAPCPRQGRGAAAEPQRGPLAQGQGAGGAAAAELEHRLRRRRGDRTPLPPAGRDRHAVLHHRRFRHPRRPGRDHPRTRHHGAGTCFPGQGPGLPRRADAGRL
ncbi:MAG: Glycyl-tRNA synthetase, partial [uncultured Arthrobacter sp.]